MPIAARRTSWEHAGLEDAEEETGGEQAAVVLDESLQQGDQAEAEHVEGEPDTILVHRSAICSGR